MTITKLSFMYFKTNWWSNINQEGIWKMNNIQNNFMNFI